MPEQLIATNPAHSFARVLLRRCQRFWQHTREFGHGLQVAGIASFSVGLGLALYWAVPQAQDLFLEIFGSWLTATLYWMFFYGLVVIAWVLPVYLSSRWMLARYNALAFMSTDDDLIPVPHWVVRLLPPLLGTLCMVGVLIGQWEAIVSAPLTGFVCESTGGKSEGCRSDLVKLAQKSGEMYDAKVKNDEPFSTGTLSIVLIGFGAVVLGFAGVGLLALLCLHYCMTVLFSSVAAERLAQAGVWLVGGGIYVYAMKLLLIGPWREDGIGAMVLGVLLLLLSEKSPYVNFSETEWAAFQSQKASLFYNAAGSPGQFATMLIVLAGAAVIVALALLVRRANQITAPGLRGWVQFSLIFLMTMQTVVCVLAVALLRRMWPQLRIDIADPFSILGLMGLPVISFCLVAATWWGLRWHSRATRNYSVRTTMPAGAFARVLIVATVALLVVVFSDPVWITDYINRAPLLPLILGVWIPVLTLIHAASMRTRVPLLLGAIALCVIVLPKFLGDPHKVRTLELAKPLVRPTLEASIARWKAVNDCETPSVENKYLVSTPGRRCPPPIIVLASGGASRAAFKVAETLGVLANRSDEIAAAKDKPSNLPPNYRSFQNRLFAISAVSGGSLAAVVYQATQAEALLARSGDSLLRPPCTKAKPDLDWFGWVALLERPLLPDQGWNSCMELTLAADFLSPTIVSLAGTDLINIRPYGDRAVTLERAWERQFKAATGQDMLAEPMVGLRNKVLGADPRNWLPLLFLNGTSVTTGRRIITSDLEPSYNYEPDCRHVPADVDANPCGRLFTDAYDLHDLLNGTDRNVDIRLSTAATMSARFPILSPNGVLRGADNRVVDRIVDGGYFDNNGAVTAQELVEVLNGRGLHATVLLIQNDPRDQKLGCEFNNREPELAALGDGGMLEVLLSPFDAFVGARNAHATLAAQRLCDLKAGRERVGEFAEFGSFSDVRVNADTDYFGDKQLSMSWWLSKHVQRRLTQQPDPGTWEWQAIGLAQP